MGQNWNRNKEKSIEKDFAGTQSHTLPYTLMFLTNDDHRGD